MISFQIRHFLPYPLKKRLWGDRKKYGLSPNKNDKCWKLWSETYSKFYMENQRNNIGNFVNDIGYKIMSKIDLEGKKILELGAGDIRHMKYWNNNPEEYIIADVSNEMMEFAAKKLNKNFISHKKILTKRNQPLPLKDSSIDIIISFYSLEHLHPIDFYINDLKRVLKNDGILIGAIPAEGGLAWGLGRMLTTRKWFLRNTKINPDKIICWEHPNFADELLLNIRKNLKRKKIIFWPFSWIKNIDYNLIISFIYKK